MKNNFEAIVVYWSKKIDECEIGVDWSEAHERCWRCGYKAKLQKCHIVPHALGGKNSIDNLVLLCHQCHREAPNIVDPAYMWAWIKSTSTSFYDTYWVMRGLQEFEKIFKRSAFEGLDCANITQEKVLSLLKKEMGKTIVHFGEGRLNPSTIAAILRGIEKALTKRGDSSLA